MANSFHRGLNLKSDPSGKIWQVKIKNRVLTGSLEAVKKSIDWWLETASIIDPKEFASLSSDKNESSGGQQENHAGIMLKNDTGAANGWYCFFNGRLMKGSKEAIKRHIDANSKNKTRG